MPRPEDFSISHDDNDNNEQQRLNLSISYDGDVHVWIDGKSPLRYRVPFIGGGGYPNTYKALRSLAKAMAKDYAKRKKV
jgi:hypothetical protein